MDSSISPKDKIRFLWVCHRISNAVYVCLIFPEFLTFYSPTPLKSFCCKFIMCRGMNPAPFCILNCVVYYQSFFIRQLMNKWVVLKTILKFTLKQLRHVPVRSHHHQGAHYSCLLKLLNCSIIMHWCVVNTVVVWLRILVGPCWCMYVALFGSRLAHSSKHE